MNRAAVFCGRNLKEILRDPMSVLFGLGFPVVILLLLTIINNSIPPEANMTLFQLANLTPGIAVFGLSFVTLFSATLISKDRSTSFVLRLFTSPMKSVDFIAGYTLPLIPISIAQMAICFLVAMALGLAPTVNILMCILVSLPIAVANISVGLICGSLLSDKAVGGICGALLTNVAAWLSGTWFSLDLVGGAFKTFSFVLPYANAVEAGRMALSGNFDKIWDYLWVVVAWAVALTVAAVIVFARKMKLK